MNGIDPIDTARLTAPAPRDGQAELKRLSHELEALFIGQLFKAMRESASNSGLVEPAPGEDMFKQWFDDELARQAAERMRGGVGDAVYRQLSKRLGPSEASPNVENAK